MAEYVQCYLDEIFHFCILDLNFSKIISSDLSNILIRVIVTQNLKPLSSIQWIRIVESRDLNKWTYRSSRLDQIVI